MEEKAGLICTYELADITYDKGGVLVDATALSIKNRGCNVTIKKHSDVYIIEYEYNDIEMFFEEETDEELLNQIEDEYIQTRKLLFGGVKKYVSGFCVFKEKKKRKLITNALTIITK